MPVCRCTAVLPQFSYLKQQLFTKPDTNSVMRKIASHTGEVTQLFETETIIHKFRVGPHTLETEGVMKIFP